MFTTPAYLVSQLVTATEDAYLSQAKIQVTKNNDLIQEGRSRDIFRGPWFEVHYVSGSLAIQAVTRRTDRVLEDARQNALANVSLLEERVSQHLSSTDTITGHSLYITAGRIEGRVYGVTSNQEAFNVYVRMMWNFRYGENSANRVITQYAQFRSERQGAPQNGQPVVTEKQVAAEKVKAERQAAKEARHSAQLEKFKKAPARLAKSARKDIVFWGESHPDASLWKWMAETAEAMTEEKVVDLFNKGLRTSGDIESYLGREFNRKSLQAVS